MKDRDEKKERATQTGGSQKRRVWVKNGYPKWVAQVNGNKDYFLRSISWWFNFDPFPDVSSLSIRCSVTLDLCASSICCSSKASRAAGTETRGDARRARSSATDATAKGGTGWSEALKTTMVFQGGFQCDFLKWTSWPKWSGAS